MSRVSRCEFHTVFFGSVVSTLVDLAGAETPAAYDTQGAPLMKGPKTPADSILLTIHSRESEFKLLADRFTYSMYLIIVGAGPVGASLVEMTVRDGHNVVLIESNEGRAKVASERFDARVLHADIAEGGILEEAGADKADAIIATTSDDSANLMAMVLGRDGGIKTLVAVVNDPRHQPMFERLGVHVLVDPEVIVARHLYYVVRQPSISEIVTLPGGAQVFEITVENSAPLVGKSLTQAGQAGLLREGLVIIFLKRGKESRIPSGKTVVQAGDELTVLAQDVVSEEQLKVFNAAQ